MSTIVNDADAGAIFDLAPKSRLGVGPVSSNGNAVLTWPANATGYNDVGYILESATSLVPPIAWQTNSTPTIVIGGQDVIINPIIGAQQFFRLSSP